MRVQPNLSKPLGYRQITALSTVKTLADGVNIAGGGPGIPVAAVGVPPPTFALIQTESQTVRWTDNGETPTAGKGMRLAPGDTLYYDGDLSALKVIEEAASAKLNVSFYAFGDA
jgi:hypothetical protein